MLNLAHSLQNRFDREGVSGSGHATFALKAYMVNVVGGITQTVVHEDMAKAV